MADMGMTHIGYSNSGNIFAGLHGPVQVSNITIKSGEGALTAGCMLAKEAATGKWVQYDDTVTDASEDIQNIGILGCDVDATSADVKAFMYVHGQFNKGKLSAVNTVSAGVYRYGAIVIQEEL